MALAMASSSVLVCFSTFSSSQLDFASNLHGNKLIISNKNYSKKPSFHHRLPAVVRCSSSLPATPTFTRKDFPDDFLFGASTSAIQIESGVSDGGRGASSIDFNLGEGSAAKSLYKYNEDVLSLVNMGVDVYRFSLSWPRLFPTGKVSSLNEEGLKYYLNLFRLLKLNNIEPIVTIFQFDLPKKLDDEYKGTLSPKFVDDFKAYAEFCFENFGKYVKNWITINEPQVWSAFMYPTRSGINGTDPYINGHNVLKAHAQTVQLYRQKYQKKQGGKIGITLNAEWFLPYDSTSRRDKRAAERGWEFMMGWFLDPVIFGDYPCVLKMIVKERLPKFTDEEKEALKGSCDFIGINYYMSHYAKHVEGQNSKNSTYTDDMGYTSEVNNSKGEPLGPQAEGNETLVVYPPGLTEILVYLKNEYNNPLVYITENGYPMLRNSDEEEDITHNLNDTVRLEYIQNHLQSILNAKKKGSNVGAYCVWNLVDCMEFAVTDPYGVRYGLVFTDFDNDYSRIPKLSANWYKKFLTTNNEESESDNNVITDEEGKLAEKKQQRDSSSSSSLVLTNGVSSVS